MKQVFFVINFYKKKYLKNKMDLINILDLKDLGSTINQVQDNVSLTKQST